MNPGTPLRRALTEAAGRVATQGCAPIGEIVDERTLVNGVVALLATGGSTNHTMHLVAVAAAAGLSLTWDDFADLSAVVPLLARVYPNGPADINHFHAAGGVAFVIGELLDAGLMHPDVETVAGFGLGRYRDEPYLDAAGELGWRPAAVRDPRRGRPAPGARRVLARRRHPRARRRAGPRGHEGLRGRPRAPGRDRARRASSTTRPTSSPPSTAASSTTTTSRSSATRARARTGCRSCTSSPRRSAC